MVARQCGAPAQHFFLTQQSQQRLPSRKPELVHTCAGIFTVPTLMARRSEISRFSAPTATSRTTSSSRGVNDVSSSASAALRWASRAGQIDPAHGEPGLASMTARRQSSITRGAVALSTTPRAPSCAALSQMFSSSAAVSTTTAGRSPGFKRLSRSNHRLHRASGRGSERRASTC